MTKSFFRQEALDASRKALIGRVAVYSPPYRWLIISLATLLIITVVLFIVFGSYTRKETATGYLLPEKGIYNVNAPVTGTITRMQVEKDSHVEGDSDLMVISSELSTDMGKTRQQIHQRLSSQLAHLQSEYHSEQTLAQETERGLTEQLSGLESQIKLLKAQQVQRAKQLKLASDQQIKLQRMRDQNFASNKQVDEQQNKVLEASIMLQDTNRQTLDVAQKIMETRLQLKEQPLNLAKKENEIERQLADVERTQLENESQRAVYIRSPARGTVGATLVTQGQVVSLGQPLLYILPENSQLQARVMVSSRAIGFINPGQQVMLRYEAYPYQKFGIQHGRVVSVSTAALLPQEVKAITGDEDIRERLFQVVVALDKQSIDLYGKTEPLRSGIRLQADFLIEKRRIIEWAFEPLYALGRRL